MRVDASANRYRWAALAGMLALVAGIATGLAGQLPSAHTLPDGVKSPILALELIRQPDQLDQIVGAENGAANPAESQQAHRATLARAIKIDFGFIAAYAAFFALTGWLMLRQWPRVPVGALVMLFGMVGAVFDIRENLAMLNLLANVRAFPRPESLWKWRLLFAATMSSVPVLVDPRAPLFRRTLGYLAALLGIIACTQGLSAAFAGSDRSIEGAASGLNLTFLLAVIFLGTRRLLAKGLLPALDRLTEWSALAWLKDWPASDQNQTVGEPVVKFATTDDAITESRRSARR
jgi:hypothetical protein